MVPLSLLPGRGEEGRGAWKIGITDCMPLLGGELRRLNVCKNNNNLLVRAFTRKRQLGTVTYSEVSVLYLLSHCSPAEREI